MAYDWLNFNLTNAIWGPIMTQNKIKKAQKKVSKILWAIDPFLEEKEVIRSAAWCIRALVQSDSTSAPVWIEPVYVWANAPISSLIPNQDFLGNLQKDSQEDLGKILAKIKIPGIQPFRLLPKPVFSVREAAQQLIAYAKQVGADLIVVSSHGRKGVKRLLLGSFAETLSLYSDIPLLIVHPNWKKMPALKTILFPTDFSVESKEAFVHVLDFAAKRKSKVILFHKMPSLVYPDFGMAFSVNNFYEDAIEKEDVTAQVTANDWAELAKKAGVKVEILFDRSQGGGSVSAAILKQAKKREAVIAMASHSGPVATVFLGSATRQVIRNSEQPVWVIHPRLSK